MNKVLICPLDWGLGHATRMIPVIANFVALKFQVVLAGDGPSIKLLEKKFPFLQVIKLASFPIKYTRGRSHVLKAVVSIPLFFYFIVREHFALRAIIKKHRINIVISDNRYGLWNKKVYSVFVTHQLNIRLPGALKVFNYLVTWKIRWYINRYDECWIPDVAENNSLAGQLSKPKIKYNNLKYIGIVSQFQLSHELPGKTDEIFYDFMVILSGPEPQRSILEERIIKVFTGSEFEVLIVSGKPSSNIDQKPGKGIRRVSFLSNEQLLKYIQQSSYVICRSGYSSIMDLTYLKKKAILVPTPGQPEQLYLAAFHRSMGNFQVINQVDITISAIKDAVKEYDTHPGIHINSSFEEKIAALVNKVKQCNKQ